MSRRLLALDPGGTTGWAAWQLVNGHKEIFETGELTGDNHHMALWDLLHRHLVDTVMLGGSMTVIVENFEFRKDERDRYKIDYIAAEYVGVAKAYCGYQQNRGFDISFVVPGASQGKGFWNDDKLKRVGMYHRNSRHIRDATRHLLRYRTFELGDRTLLDKLR